MKKEKKNFWLEHFLSPLLAASLALVGNYYLIERPDLQKEYKAIGTSIMLNEMASPEMKEYGLALINTEAPENVKLSEDEKQTKLKQLMNSIPYKEMTIDQNLTWAEAVMWQSVTINWVRDVISVCSSCVDEILFDENYSIQLKKLNEVYSQETEEQ